MTTITVQQEALPTSIVGLFETEVGVESAYKILTDLEYAPVSITLAMAEKDYRTRWGQPSLPKTDAQGGPDPGLTDEDVKSTKAAEGLALGTAAGAGVGAVALLGMAVLAPGIVIVGPLAATLVGAGAGATLGGLAGVLFGFGYPDEQIRDYEQSLMNGKYMIRVSPTSFADAEIIEREWRELGGQVKIAD